MHIFKIKKAYWVDVFFKLIIIQQNAFYIMRIIDNTFTKHFICFQ